MRFVAYHAGMKINYKKFPGKVIASGALIALLGASGAALYLDTVEEFEGYVPEGYRDPVGIPTKCFGDTRDVIVGKEYTAEECAKSLNDHAYELAAPVMRCMPGLAGENDKTKAAILSMAYNIGNGAMCKSSVARYYNAGQKERACKRMAEIYKTARGKELPGLVRRRNYESKMCLQGLNEK